VRHVLQSSGHMNPARRWEHGGSYLIARTKRASEGIDPSGSRLIPSALGTGSSSKREIGRYSSFHQQKWEMLVIDDVDYISHEGLHPTMLRL
jgi:hypothetical protein